MKKTICLILALTFALSLAACGEKTPQTVNTALDGTPEQIIEKIYAAHPYINAILQATPVHAMAFAVTETRFDPRTIPESYILLRDVKRLPYGQIYKDHQKTAAEFGEASPAIMADNDCVIVTGSTLLQAFDRLEVMESTAHSIINASAVGQIIHISDEEVEDLKVAFNLKD